VSTDPTTDRGTPGPVARLIERAHVLADEVTEQRRTDALPAPADVAEAFPTGGWEFTPAVAEVFDEHVRDSVPHYDIIQAIIAEISDWLLPAGALVADLGASTGTTVDTLIRRHPERGYRAALYDEAPAMLARAVDRLTEQVAAGRVQAYPQRVQEPFRHDRADLTTVLFLLQFLPYPDRVPVLTAARVASAPTGALLIAEKVRPVDARWAEIANAVSHDWKSEHGITADAIRAKERALRGVLQPVSLTALTRMVIDAGWYAPEVLFRWHQWVLIGAFAAPPDGWA
jgi:tRNA (cmo5U34)-methyltransferase